MSHDSTPHLGGILLHNIALLWRKEYTIRCPSWELCRVRMPLVAWYNGALRFARTGAVRHVYRRSTALSPGVVFHARRVCRDLHALVRSLFLRRDDHGRQYGHAH